MNRTKRILLALLPLCLLAVLAPDAQGCQRCGLFGRRCRMQQPVVVKSHAIVAPVAVAPVAAYQSPDVFVVQNNIPEPNGAFGLYASQGSSVYGYQAAAANYFVSPNEVLRQAAELSRAATATAQIGITGYNQTATTALSLQASIAEPLIKSQAAAQVLGAAGLSQSSSQSQSLALRISKGADGKWTVAQADAGQINAEIRAEINEHTTPRDPQEVPPVPAGENGVSLLSQRCAKCHGLNLTEPKGGLFLDAGHQLDCKTITEAIRQIKEGKMPKDGPLPPAEKAQILDELLSLEKE